MKKIWQTISYLFRIFFEHDCANRAASLAYTTLLSLVPIVMLSFWILSIFPAFQGSGVELQNYIVTHFVAHSALAISEQLEIFLDKVRVLSLTNLAALAVVSILMLYDMVNAFNSIWRVSTRRHFAWSLSFYSLVLLLTPVFFGVFMMLSSYLATIPFITDISHLRILQTIVIYLLPYVVAFIIFTFFNWILPSCYVPLRSAALAGIITTILFETFKYGFGIYITHFSNYQLIYGALATIPIFLLWIYVSWVLILLGALFCQIVTKGIPKEELKKADQSSTG